MKEGYIMLDFVPFGEAVHKQLTHMSKSELFYVDVDKNELWDLYLSSFPEGSNPMYKERTEHDCQCCKQFIRAVGNVVTIENGELVSIWDNNLNNEYGVVAKALSNHIKSLAIANRFLSSEKQIGNKTTRQLTEDFAVINWDHFHFILPDKYVKRDYGSILSGTLADKEVFKRSMEELTIDAIETVLELIEQNSLARGQEHKRTVETLLAHKLSYGLLNYEELKDNHCWEVACDLGSVARFKNTVIGTLIEDLSKDVELDIAVMKFEKKVAGDNYKRPKSLVTKKMIDLAQAKVEKLGIGESLQRRYAVTDDITINNVLFADRSVKKAMNVFDDMKKEVPDNISKLSKVEEVSIDTFIKDILPKADSIELMFDNKNVGNLMSLIAPENADAPSILKWNDNFTWSYNGEMADSMKERVKAAGGKVDGILRFSIQWNDGDNNQNDFDAHCKEPNGNLIYYSNKGRVHPSSGMLDVDIISPRTKVAVENITWSNINKMEEGVYEFIVHNFSHNGGTTGFTAEIEYDGEISTFDYTKELRNNEKVLVAKVEFSKANGIKFLKSLDSTTSTKEVWNINTNKFQKVSMIMNSPNHWDDQKIGNKHIFFMLEECRNNGKTRGFYNEFLKDSLHEHRKVFEVLGSKMKVQKSDEQLSGLGFSLTQKNSVLCKVKGAFSRTVKLNF